MRKTVLLVSVVLGAYLSACSDKSLTPCHDDIEVGIITPAPNDKVAQGFPIDLEATVRSICGNDVLADGDYTVSTDLDGSVVGESSYAENEYAFTTEELLTIGTHTVTLNVVGSNGADGEDTVSLQVIENVPPSVFIEQPGPGTEIWPVETGAEIVAYVSDEQEPLETLVLSWTLNGEALAEGPTHADTEGRATFTLSSADAGCHTIAVTVTDAMDQSATDDGDVVIYADDAGMNAYRWWIDEDDDEWGIEVGEIVSCEQPAGTTGFTSAIDCDDNDPEVHPGAADYCNDGVDTDCDVATPEGCFPYGEVAASLSDAYLPGGILDVSGTGDVDGDGVDDLAVGASDGATHVFSGPLLGELFSDYALQSDLPGGGLESFRGQLGTSLDGGMDQDGDGIADLVLGNPGWAYACLGNDTVAAGKAYMLLGASDFPDGVIDDVTADGAGLAAGKALMVTNDYTTDCDIILSEVGGSVTQLGDVDDDGLADFAVGAPVDDSAESGSVYLYLSSDMADFASGFFADSGFRLRLMGGPDNSLLGTALGSADVDGDGLSDLLISGFLESEGSAGVVYVVLARDVPDAQTEIEVQAIASLTFTGMSDDARLGADIQGVGDLDGDGDEDFLVAAPGEREGRGVVYLVPGFYEVDAVYGVGDLYSEAATPNARNAVQFIGEEGDGMQSCALAGDLNNDGHLDLLMGGPGHSTAASEAGAAYVVYGGPDHWGDWWDGSSGIPLSPTYVADSAASKLHTAKIYSETAGDQLGTSVDAAGDVNGDGIDDIVIGASSVNGTMRVFFGGGT